MFNSFLGFLFKALPAGEVHAHGGGGRKRGKSSRVGGGGATPKTDAKKQELVKKLSQKALKDPKNFRKTTSLTSRKIVSHFQLGKQQRGVGVDYSKAITKSINRNKAKTTGIKNNSSLKKSTKFRVDRSSRFGV